MLDFALTFHDLFGSAQTGLWFVGCSCGIVYVKARGWRMDCMGRLDPCLRNDNLSCNPLQCRFEFVLVLGAVGFPLLCTDNEGIRFLQMSLFCLVPPARHATNRKECPAILAHPIAPGVWRARLVGQYSNAGIRNLMWVTGSSTHAYLHESYLCSVRTTVVPVLTYRSIRSGSCGANVGGGMLPG